jgi:FkbM family methyltransferase
VLGTDTFIGRSLIEYGEWTESEISVLRQLLRPGDNVVDIGANIGSHTVALAKAIQPSGRVLAFEPQPKLFQLLASNVTVNGLTNVRLFHAGCGSADEIIRIPDINYRANTNYGAIKLNSLRERVESDTSTLQHAHEVPVRALDGLINLPQLRLIKIDVEGMEPDVIRGAEQTIRKFRPILYVENEFPEISERLLEIILDLDYAAYWHIAPLYSSKNFRANPENLFKNIACINNLCFPKEMNVTVTDLRPVRSTSEHPRGQGFAASTAETTT